ncbi:CGLD27 family protein [Leptolyngbyaceae cyanobacterium UHCC 1019]
MLPDDPTQNLSIAACPVPSEQLPLNEYEDLKESWFFRWATLERSRYVSKIIWVWLWSWAIAAPIAAASFPFEKYPAKFLLTSSGGGILLLGLVLIRLYLGWSYISSRLMDANVFYEESGWYDGQTWIKPAEVLARDRLVASYQIQPILKQMQVTFAVLAGLWGIGAIIWQLLN